MRLPVGGDSPAGKLLLEFIKYQADLENLIPLVSFVMHYLLWRSVALYLEH
jgi:hypothetical protein